MCKAMELCAETAAVCEIAGAHGLRRKWALAFGDITSLRECSKDKI